MEASTKRLVTRLALAAGVLGLVAIQVFAEGVSLLAAFANSLQSGAIYALVGLGLVLVYRATGVLNFAQGELGTIPAFIVLIILLARGKTQTLPGLEDAGLLEKELDPTLISGLELFGWTLAAIAVGALLAVGVYWLVIKRLQDASPVISLVATAGVALLFTQAEILFFEARIRKFPRYIDSAPCLSGGEGDVCATPLTFFGTTTLQWHTLVIVLVLAIAAVLLALFFRTPAGVALLATAQEPFAASLHGISVQAMAMTAWAAAGALAAVAGVLAAGAGEALSPGLMTSTFLIPAFTGAVLGGLDSMPGAVVGGLALGFSVQLATTWWTAFDWQVVPGEQSIMTFVVLLAVLLFRPRGLFGRA